MKTMARVLGVLAVVATCSITIAADAVPDLLLIDGARIADLKTRVRANDPALAPAFAALKADAEKALAMTPVSVMEKGVTPPSGDKHDYMSQAPYFWPDPAKPDGRPYIRKDGQRNPEINKIPDHENIFKVTGAVSTLGLAYALSGREDYATQATRLVRTWFLDPATKMNPHLRFGQGIPGINDGRGIGIIETRSLPELLDGVTLLRGSKAWTDADQQGLQAWMRQYVQWLVDSQYGKDEGKNGNNHEIWYETQVTALALWTGQKDLAARTLERGRESLAKQIEPDGKMPRELERTNPWQYSAFNLEAFFNLARLGERAGVDLLNYRTADGRSLRQAVDFLVPFASGDQKWPYEQLSEFHPNQLHAVLRRAALVWHEPKYRELAMKVGGSNWRLDLLDAASASAPASEKKDYAAEAKLRGQRFDRAVASMRRVLQVWLTHADPKTLLLPDRIPGIGSGLQPGDDTQLYTPHNSGADLYPYLILTAELTDPDIYRGRMMQMLRNEVRYTNVLGAIPGNLELKTGKLGPASMFGAGEYAKDGLLTVTEYLGRTPWYARMVDMVADAMQNASVDSKFGKLPASDSELNGDYLQVLARLGNMSGDARYVDWARRIADAYLDEVLPGSHDVPSGKWDFTAHTGDQHLRLRDHGNELVVGLVLQYANEQRWKTPRAEQWRPKIARMLDRILESANPDGLLYDEVDTATLKPFSQQLSDNWGYIYGAVYTFYQCTGETKYRDAVLKVLRDLPKYHRYNWEPRPKVPELKLGSFDGYADTIESALYLVAREPVPEALDWIESEMQVMFDMQKPDGHIEYWYGEGNYNRTVMLYALMQSRGVRPVQWKPGVRVGAVQDGPRLHLNIALPAGMTQTPIRFDYARHRRVLNLDKNYVRLNEFPEWFTVDDNALYRLRRAGSQEEMVRLGSELMAGVPLRAGDWTIELLK